MKEITFFKRELINTRTALLEIKNLNRINNDLEAYLYEVAKWGLGESEKPNPVDYGIE